MKDAKTMAGELREQAAKLTEAADILDPPRKRRRRKTQKATRAKALGGVDGGSGNPQPVSAGMRLQLESPGRTGPTDVDLHARDLRVVNALAYTTESGGAA